MISTGDGSSRPAGPIEPPVVRHSVEKATDALWQDQSPDGTWTNPLYGGPAFTGMMLATEHYLGTLGDKDAAEAVRWLRPRQLQGGAFPDYPFGYTGSLATTACVYAGMTAAGVPLLDPAMQRAWACIESAGGLLATDPLTRIFLVMAGVMDPAELPVAPLLYTLVPRLPQYLGRFLTGEALLLLHEAPVLCRALRRQRAADSCLPHPIERAEDARVLAYLSERQNPDGDWLGVLPSTLLGAACLHALGVPRSDPRLARACASFAQWKVRGPEGLFVVPVTSAPWDAADALRTLIGGGIANPPGARRTVDYLIAQQTRLAPPPDLQELPAGAPRIGGWPFEAGNQLGPDTDTTALVLLALKEAGADPAVIDRGVAWLLAMQNPDGGWPMYAHGQPSKRPGPMEAKPGGLNVGVLDIAKAVFEPHVGFSDPSSEGVTARVLAGLARLGYTRRNEEVRRAIEFLKYQRNPDGIWWERWVVNYLAATSYVLSGLAAVGENMGAPYVQQAVRWMKSRQNPDGGWGETVDTYTTPALAGRGESRPSLTGLVLAGLIDAGEAAAPEVERGIRYLLATQEASGHWREEYPMKVIQPPDAFFHDPLYVTLRGLQALSLYLRSREVGHSGRPLAWTPGEK